MLLALLASSALAQPERTTLSTEQLYNETYRPQFHFTPMKNWTNDPNGLVFYKGEYHLFFQHNPKGINWGNMTWGHAVSPDLVHWTQLANAIEPDNLGTIFSGSAVIDWNNTTGFGKESLVCIYTSAGKPFTHSIAYSTDRGRTFTKYENNPVLQHIAGENRDPKVIWHEPTKKWVMALFLDKNDYAFYASPDLKAWSLLHNITVPGCGECPDFFPMAVDGKKENTKWVWTAANGRYLIGSFDGNRFTPDDPTPRQADWGKNYYAVQTYSDIPDSDGRRIQIAWMNGGSYPRMPFNQQLSFPCEMKLKTTPQGLRIFRTPVKEIELLHGKVYKWADASIKPGENLLAGVSSDLLDIRAEVEMGPASTVEFALRGASVSYDATKKTLTSLSASAPMEMTTGRIKLRILLDRTSIEVFGNDGLVPMTSCFLPKPADQTIQLNATGGEAKLISMTVYELKSAWQRR